MGTTWTEIAQAISNLIKLPPKIIDLIANMEVIELCARGSSLSTISIVTGIPVEEVKEILKQYDMTFFISSLFFDAIAFYKDASGNRREYFDHLCYLYPDIDEELLYVSFDNVEKFINYRKEIDAYYADSNS